MKNEEKEAIKVKYNIRQNLNGFKMKLIDELVKGSQSDNQIAIGLGVPSGTFYSYKKELPEAGYYF